MHRYLAILWDSLNLESARTFQSLKLNFANQPADWAVACDRPGTFVMHTGPRRGSTGAYLLQENGGVVLGRIFDARDGHTAIPVAAFDAGETRKILSSAGKHLIDRYWGAYVAIVHDEAACRHHVFRDPIGNVPCYHTRFNGIDVFFSHIEDCARLLNLNCSIDRQYLIRWLIFFALTTRDTGIEDVECVPAAERMTISHGRITRSVLWDPIAIAGDAHLEQVNEAAGALRSTVQNTINAWAGCYENITHKLSGGLDSSIVAGCLAHVPSKPRISYLNVAIDIDVDQERLLLPGMDPRMADKARAIAGNGDERYFARLVAERWKTSLLERQRSLTMDLRRLWDAPLRISPAMYFTNMEMDDAELEMIKTQGAQAFFSGQSGDSVFLATQLPLPAIDYVYLHGLKSGLWEQLAATSKLSRESLWSVFGKAVRHGLLRRPDDSVPTPLDQPTLVNADFVAGLRTEDLDSDLAKRVSRSSLPPGKRNHVGGITWSAYYDFVFESGKYADHVDPLNSQPVWEVVLRIPTCTVLTGGISRGLARKAFADLLPAEIRKRQVKGTGSPFYQHLVRRNKDFLRERLVDGLLVRHGYLDRRRLLECLTAQEPSMTIYPVTILNYLAAEIWLEQWTEHRLYAGVQNPTALQKAIS